MRNANRERACDIIALVMWGPTTPIDIAEITNYNVDIVRSWLHTLHRAGVIRITCKRGKSPVYEMQTKPFALPDNTTHMVMPVRRRKKREDRADAGGSGAVAPSSDG